MFVRLIIESGAVVAGRGGDGGDGSDSIDPTDINTYFGTVLQMAVMNILFNLPLEIDNQRHYWNRWRWWWRWWMARMVYCMVGGGGGGGAPYGKLV